MKRIDGLTIKEKIAIIVNNGDGKYHKNKVEALVTLIQKEREEAVRGFGKYLTDEGWVDGYTYGYDLYKWIETYLSQTKGGKGE